MGARIGESLGTREEGTEPARPEDEANEAVDEAGTVERVDVGAVVEVIIGDPWALLGPLGPLCDGRRRRFSFLALKLS